MRTLARRLGRSVVPLFGAVLLTGSGCFFNSDDQGGAEESSTTELPTSTSSPEWTSGDPLPIPDMAEGDLSCRDAIDCLVECAANIQIGPGDGDEELGCLLECGDAPGLTEEEALALIRLANCQALICADQGECGGDGETGGEEEGGGPLGPDCLQCIIGGILDPEPPGCLEEASACT